MSKKHALVVWSAVLLLATLLFRSASANAAAPRFDVFAASDCVRVFEDGYARPERLAEIRAFGLRNEVISAQCVIDAHEDVEDLSVSVSDLARREGSATISADKIQWNFVRGIFIAQNTPKLRSGDLVRPAPAQFPDCLTEDRRCSVSKGTLKAVYLTIRIPR